MASAWKENIPKIWQERKTPLPECDDPRDLIWMPENAQYFAALGAVEFGKQEEDCVGVLPRHASCLRTTSMYGRDEEKSRPPARRRTPGFPRGAGRVHGALRAASRSSRPLSRRARWCGASSASMADRRPPRPAAARRQDRNVLSRPTSSPRATRSRTPTTSSGRSKTRSTDAGATLEVLGDRHHRLRQGHPQGRPAAPTSALVETVAHTESGLHFYSDIDVICRRRRPGHQAHRPQERAGQGLQAQHAMLGRQRLLPAIHRAGIRLRRARVRRHRLRRGSDADRSAMAARCSCSPTSSTSSARGGSRKRSWRALPTCCRRTSGSTLRRCRTLPALGTRFRPAGRHAAQPCGGQVAGGLHRAAFHGQGDAGANDHRASSTAARPAPSARRLRPGACTAAAQHRVHRHRPRSGDHLHIAPQRGHALLLLQEPLPAHVHRRQVGEDLRRRTASSKIEMPLAGGSSG